MKIEIELVTDADLLSMGYTHVYTTFRPDGIADRSGLSRGMTESMIAALFAGETLQGL